MYNLKEKDEDCSYTDMNKSKAPLQQLITCLLHGAESFLRS